MTSRTLAVRGLSARVIASAFAFSVALTASALGAAQAAPAAATIETLISAALGRVDQPMVQPPVMTPAPAPLVFLNPAPGFDVDSPFGLRRLPWEGHGRLHAGVDIAGPKGAAVVAACDGVVTKAGTSPSYGRFVEVAHPSGLTTFYAHLGRASAVVGQAVAAGETVGYMGSTGVSTGPHLHFEVRQGDTPLDPTRFMGQTFATAADLPVAAAAVVAPTVREAVVSNIPSSKRASARSGTRRVASGRVRGRVRMDG